MLNDEERWLLEDKFNGQKNEKFLLDLKKLKKGYPLAYLIGWVDFINIKINLDFKPLIPRVETEYWVFNFIKEERIREKKDIKILDIFSGSGCIGLSILKENKNLSIHFSEINKKFIKQIEKNIKINDLNKKNIKIYQSDLFDKIPKNEKYDYILANPPYIPKWKKIDKSVFKHEDYCSLFAEDDGLFFVKKLIKSAPNFLKKNGKIYIEFDELNKNKIELFLKKEKIKNFIFKKDQFKNDRLLIIKNI